MSSTTSFSTMSPGPWAPGSWPPWPASRTIRDTPSPSCRASENWPLEFAVGDPVVVPDGPPVGAAISAAVADGARVVLTTGGTGLTPTDRTPEQTRALLDFEVPGIGEAIRAYGAAKGIPAAALSRGTAGVIGSCLVVNLPGSKGGVKDGLEVLAPILEHAVEQIVGSDH